MKDFSEKWQWIACIILVTVVVLWGLLSEPFESQPKERAGTFENYPNPF